MDACRTCQLWPGARFGAGRTSATVATVSARLLARAIAIAACCAAATAARAQGFDPSQRLDAFTGPTIASGRILGLGGAYVGVAEGLGGAALNPASVAHRNRHLDRSWDWDGVLTWYLPDVGAVTRSDVGNDGTPDGRLTGVANLQLGLMGQTGRLGAGILARAWALAAPHPAFDTLEVGTQDVAVSIGWSALRDALVVGVGLTSVHGAVNLRPGDGPPTTSLRYDGSTLRLGALLRPRGRPFRVGAALDLGGRARPAANRPTFPVATASEVAFPWTLAFGLSAWIGPNAARYNEPPPVALARHPEWGHGPGLERSRRRPVLVSGQLDVIGPVHHAVSVESALLTGDPIRSGADASFVVRAGAEWEGWPDVLRVRGGTYLEPSRTGGSVRPHGTFGLEVRVPFWPWDLQVGFAADVARMYTNASLSVGFWSDLGPSRVGAAPPLDAATSG